MIIFQPVFASHFTGIYDVNRNNILPNDNYTLVKEWADSIIKIGLKGVIFHNNFSEGTIQTYQNDNIEFVKVDYDERYSPNVFRYFVYYDYLLKHHHKITHLFITDIADVVVVNNPFNNTHFISNQHRLFCGDEPKPLDNEWMRAHCAHFRNKIADFVQFEDDFGHETLLNCGVVGGSIKVMKEFLEMLCELHLHYNQDNKSGFTGDMGAFNYLLRTQFNDRLVHGFPCTTVFKAYQIDRNDCWFRHK